MSGVWVFGYGSLVSPASFGHTLGRELRMHDDIIEAELSGYGRRWNYGTHMTFVAPRPDDTEMVTWTFIALGIVESADETANGVIAWVSDDELPALDDRERFYDRVDVTDRVSVDGGPDAPIVTYVPRSEAIDRYLEARDRGAAAVTQRYWDLVDGAFGDLGPDRRERYHATTPAPDIPVVAIPDDQTPLRHRMAPSAR